MYNIFIYWEAQRVCDALFFSLSEIENLTKSLHFQTFNFSFYFLTKFHQQKKTDLDEVYIFKV